ncbi:hypothetical protein, variant 1 [Aphanomyces astaci]|uniref:Uncharacterized protein n=1 Tax=Aphanomyces astaci TaxID=112090 RepID=W4GCI1_APHAT|nr:hypothetical protein, variant 1 [Aphanomyces astaci]ETV76779.1 hypothetical protein, variant 1 [Aphanomyces astaci]|eukprot:XP_009833690.1 hypothetical protein, variant 1 [Aphanomyces astaci]
MINSRRCTIDCVKCFKCAKRQRRHVTTVQLGLWFLHDVWWTECTLSQPDDGGFERQVRELTQDVLDAGDHYKASASTELELVRAQCTVAFHDMNIAKGMNQDLKTQVEVVEERLREYDTSAASDDMYEKKLQKLHDLQHQAKDTSDTIHRMRRTLEAKQKTLQEQEPAMEVWRQLAAEKERTDQTLKQIQAQLASVHRDQTVLARKHQLAVEKAERTMQYTRNQCDLARKDLYRQQYAVENVTTAMKSLSSCASQLKLPTFQATPQLARIQDDVVVAPRQAIAKPNKKKTNRVKR